MRTEELQEYMLADPYIANVYGGVVALDGLPDFVRKPSIYIVNSDPSSEPGKHWYAVYFNRINEHFDSAGFYPNSTLESHLIAYGPRFMYNDKRVQAHHSDTCGLFCLFYCYFRCRGVSFKQIMDMFSSNLALNEEIVKYFYQITM